MLGIVYTSGLYWRMISKKRTLDGSHALATCIPVSGLRISDLTVAGYATTSSRDNVVMSAQTEDWQNETKASRQQS